MITAYGTQRIAVEAMKAGAEDYLPKPVDNDELRLKVRRIVVPQKPSSHIVAAQDSHFGLLRAAPRTQIETVFVTKSASTRKPASIISFIPITGQSY